MRMRNKLVAGAAVVATATALTTGAALADPPKGVVPAPDSVVSVGANTTQYLSDALSATWDSKFPKATQLYSWDALDAAGVDNKIVTKSGCVAITRPNGSNVGITDLELNTPDGTGHFCIDFARSSRGPKTTDLTDITFVALAKDNVTYASLAKHSNVPGNLSTAQLHDIYTCNVTRKGFKINTWGALLGKKAKKGTSNTHIAPYLPQPGSGTLSFFEKAIGISVSGPGKCVTQPATLEENEGTNKVYKSKTAPNILIPYSAGDWVAQAFHSAVCGKKPSKGQNAFGCDQNGVLGLNDINGTSPTAGKGAKTALNSKFTSDFIRTLYDVVRGTDSIPTYLVTFLGPTGWYCSNPTLIRDYGFLPDPKCGTEVSG
jgi:ABC-type phosphate transport system substrate-binding protein